MDDKETRRVLADLDESQRAAELERLSLRVRKRPLVLFFGRAGFSDNSKYAFLHALGAPRPYDVMWCTFDDALHEQLTGFGLPCLHLARDMRATLDILLHAAVAVFCVNPNESLRASYGLAACLAGARQLQLWHGISVKHLMLELMQHLDLRTQSLRRGFDLGSRCDAVLSTASAFDGFWHRTFNAGTLLRGGFPRNEVILRDPQPLEMLGAEVDDATAAALLAPDRRKLLLVPTWQRIHSTWLTSPEALQRIVAFGRKHGITVFVKTHPMTLPANPATYGERGNGVFLLDTRLDIYPWMRAFDVLVTDYSSILFDFLLTGRPVLTLDLQPGEHQRFEPDWSLLPAMDEYRHRFRPEDLERTLAFALAKDGLAEARAAAAARLFETAPLNACAATQAFIDRWMTEPQTTDYTLVDPLDTVAAPASFSVPRWMPAPADLGAMGMAAAGTAPGLQ